MTSAVLFMQKGQRQRSPFFLQNCKNRTKEGSLVRKKQVYFFSSSGITPRLEMVLGLISPAADKAILVRIGPTSS